MLKPHRRIAFPALATTMLLFAGAAFAEERVVDYHIATQDLSEALNQFAVQSGLQLVYSPSLVANLSTHGLQGKLAPQEALTQLLVASGLEFEFVNGNTLVLRKKGGETGKNVDTPAVTGDVQQQVTGSSIRVAQNDSATDEAQGSPRQQQANQEQQALMLDEIVVTGTHIRGIAPASSPLTIYAREDIDRSGVATVDQFLRLLPQNFASIDSTSANRSATAGFSQGGGNNYGGASVNLRGLGPGATLILLNGRRLSPAGSTARFTDISMIPLSAVERIEVLSDGASALYGSDAIAGVVNFVLRKDFDGAETSLRYAGATRGGAHQLTGSQLLGTSWGRGNALLTYEYDDKDGLLATERDFVPVQGGGRVVIVPPDTRNSVFLTARQELTGTASLSGDVYYSERDFFSEFWSGFVNRNEGSVKQYGGALAVTKEMTGDWRTELAAHYSKTNQESLTTFPDFDFSFTDFTDPQIAGIELRSDGSLFKMPAGTVKAALGAAYRAEEIRTGTDSGPPAPPERETLDREVLSVFGEIFVPLLGAQGSDVNGRRLELSLSARYDDYNDAGSSVDPKVGLLWHPIPSLNLRGTFGTSFRAPLLTDLRVLNFPIFSVYGVPDPTAPDQVTNTLLIEGNDPGIRPEESESFTLGFDFKPTSLPGFSLSATYYRTRFTDRIAAPPLPGNVYAIYTLDTGALDSFIQRSPSLTDLAPFYADPNVPVVQAETGEIVAPDDVDAIFDFRNTNISRSTDSGIEFSTAYAVETAHGEWTMTLSGNYLLDQNYRATPTAGEISLLNIVGEPADLRLRGGLGWTRRGWGSSLFVNYTTAYDNVLFSPSQDVGSWKTVDWQATYEVRGESASGPLAGLALALSIQNFTDEKPPFVAFPPTLPLNLGYDATNASPLGRVIAVQAKKRW